MFCGFISGERSTESVLKKKNKVIIQYPAAMSLCLVKVLKTGNQFFQLPVGLMMPPKKQDKNRNENVLVCVFLRKGRRF